MNKTGLFSPILGQVSETTQPLPAVNPSSGAASSILDAATSLGGSLLPVIGAQQEERAKLAEEERTRSFLGGIVNDLNERKEAAAQGQITRLQLATYSRRRLAEAAIERPDLRTDIFSFDDDVVGFDAGDVEQDLIFNNEDVVRDTVNKSLSDSPELWVVDSSTGQVDFTKSFQNVMDVRKAAAEMQRVKEDLALRKGFLDFNNAVAGEARAQSAEARAARGAERAEESHEIGLASAYQNYNFAQNSEARAQSAESRAARGEQRAIASHEVGLASAIQSFGFAQNSEARAQASEARAQSAEARAISGEQRAKAAAIVASTKAEQEMRIAAARFDMDFQKTSLAIADTTLNLRERQNTLLEAEAARDIVSSGNTAVAARVRGFVNQLHESKKAGAYDETSARLQAAQIRAQEYAKVVQNLTDVGIVDRTVVADAVAAAMAPIDGIMSLVEAEDSVIATMNERSTVLFQAEMLKEMPAVAAMAKLYPRVAETLISTTVPPNASAQVIGQWKDGMNALLSIADEVKTQSTGDFINTPKRSSSSYIDLSNANAVTPMVAALLSAPDDPTQDAFVIEVLSQWSTPVADVLSTGNGSILQANERTLAMLTDPRILGRITKIAERNPVAVSKIEPLQEAVAAGFNQAAEVLQGAFDVDSGHYSTRVLSDGTIKRTRTSKQLKGGRGGGGIAVDPAASVVEKWNRYNKALTSLSRLIGVTDTELQEARQNFLPLELRDSQNSE